MDAFTKVYLIKYDLVDGFFVVFEQIDFPASILWFQSQMEMMIVGLSIYKLVVSTTDDLCGENALRSP